MEDVTWALQWMSLVASCPPAKGLNVMFNLLAMLNKCHEEMQGGVVSLGFNELLDSLNEYRLAVDEDTWLNQIVPTCRSHPITDILHQDPYTRRALDRPRGYAGDAVMMDYLYFQTPPHCTVAGKAVFSALTTSTNGDSVRWRRLHIAGLIRDLASKGSGLSVMSVACGHCREVQLLDLATLGKIARYVAADQDPLSIQVVQESTCAPVVALHTSAKALAHDTSLQSFDFIYSAGLFDYLADRPAQAWSKALWAKVKPGGKLLLANFTPDNCGRGYMGAFMDWELVVRTRNDMLKLLPRESVANSFRYFDPYRNVVYLQVIKA